MRSSRMARSRWWRAGPAPTVAVTSDFDVWMRVIAYQHDPLMAYQEGLFTVEGDMEKLLESDTWFRRA